jgi:L-aspartate oxidase
MPAFSAIHRLRAASRHNYVEHCTQHLSRGAVCVRVQVHPVKRHVPRSRVSSTVQCNSRKESGEFSPGLDSQSNAEVVEVDFLVLGSGIAGLSYALKVAQYGTVAIVTKGEAAEGCTRYAQGGISAVLDAHDSVRSHVKDTLIAGAFLNNMEAVETVCSEGPARVLELAALGAEFSTDSTTGNLHLTKEGGHSARRVVHAADATGAEIERALLSEAHRHPNISFHEHMIAVDLVQGKDANDGPIALGADVLCLQHEKLYRFVAFSTLLATGGAGQVYPLTTNPLVSTGDGIAMAHRADAAVENMEFVQFHPTALYSEPCLDVSGPPSCTAFLISEAVRGEGGILLSADGTRRFMEHIDPRKELAPRDIVARAIQSEMVSSGSNHVLLDVSHLPRNKIEEHFPNIASHCQSLGIDVATSPIPVLPAQHYLCGGVKAGLNGETNIPGLYACGEVACSGLHGANRLASNSLLEGLVFGARAVQATVKHKQLVAASKHGMYAGALMRARNPDNVAEAWGRPPRGMSEAASAWVQAKRTRLQSIMWDAAGIVRDHEKMKKALQEIADLYVESRVICESYGVNRELVELRNLVTVGELILSSALQRKESRGGHYRVDYPRSIPNEDVRATVISSSAKRRLNLTPVWTDPGEIFTRTGKASL